MPWNRQRQSRGGIPRVPLLVTSGSYLIKYGDLDRWGVMKMKTSRFVVADAGKVAGTTALSSPVGAHGPVEKFTLLSQLRGKG